MHWSAVFGYDCWSSVRRQEDEAQRIDAMPLVCAIAEPLSTENVSEMPVTTRAKDFASTPICVALLVYRVLDIRPKSRPTAPAVELHVTTVQGHFLSSCATRTTQINPTIVMVIKALRDYTTSWFSGFLAEHFVLVRGQIRPPVCGAQHDVADFLPQICGALLGWERVLIWICENGVACWQAPDSVASSPL